MQNQSNIIVEKKLQTNTGFRYKFDSPHSYVIYFEKEQNIELNLFIRKNYNELKNKFASIFLSNQSELIIFVILLNKKTNNLNPDYEY